MLSVKKTVQLKSLTLQVHYSPGMVSSQWHAIGDSDEIVRSVPVDAACYAGHPADTEVLWTAGCPRAMSRAAGIGVARRGGT